MTIEKTAGICRALGDENRLKIIGLLTGGELCACRILEKLDITQPTLSHHIKILCECGLVNARRDGKWMHYSLNSILMRWNVAQKINCGKDLHVIKTAKTRMSRL